MIQLLARHRILVRMPSWLGDFVMAEPAIRALVEWREQADAPGRLTLVGPGPFLELIEGRFEGVELCPDRRDADLKDWRDHDVALFLDGSTRSVWRALRAGIPARVGWARGGKGLLLTDSIRPARERGGTPAGLGRPGRWPRILPRPFSSVCHELFVAMGVPIFDLRPRLEVSEPARSAVIERIRSLGQDPDGSFVLVNAGGRRGSSKAYDPLRWGRAIDICAEENEAPFFVVGGPGEEERVRATVAAAQGPRVLPILDPVADLRELAAWCARARYVLTADGGVRHVASAVGARQTVLFGPSDPRHTADVWAHEQHFRVGVPCGPCHLELCPVEGDLEHACMTGIRPEDVAASALLDRSGR